MRGAYHMADNDTAAPITVGDWYRSIPSVAADWPTGVLSPANVTGDAGGNIETACAVVLSSFHANGVAND